MGQAKLLSDGDEAIIELCQKVASLIESAMFALYDTYIVIYLLLYISRVKSTVRSTGNCSLLSRMMKTTSLECQS
jgi:hypothetical protein